VSDCNDGMTPAQYTALARMIEGAQHKAHNDAIDIVERSLLALTSHPSLARYAGVIKTLAGGLHLLKLDESARMPESELAAAVESLVKAGGK